MEGVMSKNKFVQWIVSTWVVQVLMRLVFRGWCFVRKNDKRFIVSDPLSYEGDSDAASGHHHLREWNTWICVLVPTASTYIMLDIHTGQRFVLLGKKFCSGEIVALKVGHEGASIRFGHPSGGGMKYAEPPHQLGRWKGNRDELTPEMVQRGITPDKIIYI